MSLSYRNERPLENYLSLELNWRTDWKDTEYSMAVFAAGFTASFFFFFSFFFARHMHGELRLLRSC